jgi:AcrR family transcriptional regulator
VTDPAHRPLLTRTVIVAAAVEVARSEGVEAVTMRRVATDLGTAPMSLYRHVADKDALLQEMLDVVASTLRDRTWTGEPLDVVVDAADDVRALLAADPWVVDVLAAGRLFSLDALGWFETVYTALRALGLTEAVAAQGTYAVWEHLVGHLVMRRQRDPGSRADRQERTASADLSRYPGLAELMAAPPIDLDGPYRSVVRAFVRGLSS